MKQLYETYHADEKLSTLLRELPWSQFECTMLGNQKLSAVLRELQPNINQTFNDNLWNMKRFYERFDQADTKMLQAVAVLPWGITC